MKVSPLILLLLFSIYSFTGDLLADSAPRIQVNAILKNAAVVTINGKQQMLRKNAISKEGYKLTKIEENKVTLLVEGEFVEVKIGAVITSSKSDDVRQSVRISRDNNGMYFTSGAINDFPVNFLVDTGATFIAINSNLAKQIGIDYRRLGKPQKANTASGVVTAWKLVLNRVSIGGLQLYLVDAAVIEGNFPIKPLLGMSFLNRVKMKDDGLLLTIEAKY